MAKYAVPSLSYGSAYAIPVSSVSYLEGRVLTLIETLGLRESQEKAFKDLFRTELWNFMREQSVWMTEDEHNAVRQRNADSMAKMVNVSIKSK